MTRFIIMMRWHSLKSLCAIFFLFYCQACDLWSMGVTLFSLVFGEVPFLDENVLSVYHKIKTEPVRFPEEPVISDQLKDLIVKLLTKVRRSSGVSSMSRSKRLQWLYLSSCSRTRASESPFPRWRSTHGSPPTARSRCPRRRRTASWWRSPTRTSSKWWRRYQSWIRSSSLRLCWRSTRFRWVCRGCDRSPWKVGHPAGVPCWAGLPTSTSEGASSL